MCGWGAGLGIPVTCAVSSDDTTRCGSQLGGRLSHTFTNADTVSNNQSVIVLALRSILTQRVPHWGCKKLRQHELHRPLDWC